MSFDGVDGESLLIGISDIAVSSGSACSSASGTRVARAARASWAATPCRPRPSGSVSAARRPRTTSTTRSESSSRSSGTCDRPRRCTSPAARSAAAGTPPGSQFVSNSRPLAGQRLPHSSEGVAMADFDDRSGRDSRLLALVILIAVAVLVVLARFRFPQTDTGPAAVTPGPLERLAARATYDDLAAAVHTALQRVEPALITRESSSPIRRAPRTARGEAPPASADARSRVARAPWRRLGASSTCPADSTWRAWVIRSPCARSMPGARSRDVFGAAPIRRGQRARRVLPSSRGSRYVCVVEPTPDGPTATPMFIGRVRTSVRRAMERQRTDSGRRVDRGARLAAVPARWAFSRDCREPPGWRHRDCSCESARRRGD